MPVDRFFDNVMVMDKNEDLKRNRLSMLGEIRERIFHDSRFLEAEHIKKKKQ
ncbi:MAG: hypothetical protein R3B51_06530 [Thermodesulfobacteriota bacterium]